MPIDHGVLPVDVKMARITASRNTPKKQAPLDNSGQSSKKSNRNAQVFGEIEKISNMPIDHGGSKSLADHHHNTTTKLFTRGLIDFKASVDERMMANLYLDILKSLKHSTNLANELSYNISRRLQQNESHAGNKRSIHAARMTTKPATKKRQKISEKQHAAVRKLTSPSKALQKPDYSFRARNSMFPDPNNCEAFHQQRRDETPTNLHQLNATATKRKLETTAPLTKSTHQSAAPTA